MGEPSFALARNWRDERDVLAEWLAAEPPFVSFHKEIREAGDGSSSCESSICGTGVSTMAFTRFS